MAPISFQSFKGMKWHQRGSEARRTDGVEVFSLEPLPKTPHIVDILLGEAQRETGLWNLSHLGFVFYRLEAVPSGLCKWHKELRTTGLCVPLRRLEAARELFPAAVER